MFRAVINTEGIYSIRSQIRYVNNTWLTRYDVTYFYKFYRNSIDQSKSLWKLSDLLNEAPLYAVIDECLIVIFFGCHYYNSRSTCMVPLFLTCFLHSLCALVSLLKALRKYFKFYKKICDSFNLQLAITTFILTFPTFGFIVTVCLWFKAYSDLNCLHCYLKIT